MSGQLDEHTLSPRGSRRRRVAARKKNPFFHLERLEERVTPVIGSIAVAPTVLPGAGFDGVVNLSGCSGTLLETGRHVLTAAHCVDSDGDAVPDDAFYSVTFNMPNDRVVRMTVPAANVTVHPNWGGSMAFDNGFDVAVFTLPEFAPVDAERFRIADPADGAVGADPSADEFTDSTGGVTADIQRNAGDYLIRFLTGANAGLAREIDSADAMTQTIELTSGFPNVPAQGDFFEYLLRGATIVGYGNTGTGDEGQLTGTSWLKRIGYNQLEATNDLSADDGGAMYQNGIIGAVFDPPPGGFNESEAMLGQGDSGGPLFLGRQIVGIASYVSGSAFGASMYWAYAPQFQGFVDGVLDDPGVITLDMTKQTDGNDGVPDLITVILNDDLSVSFVVNGRSLPAVQGGLIESIVVLGSDDDDTIRFIGDLDYDIETSGGRGYDDIVFARSNDDDDAVYTPGNDAGEGEIEIDTLLSDFLFTFSGFEPLTVSGLASFTLNTTGRTVATVSVESPDRNIVTGTHNGGVEFESVTFFDVTSFFIDTDETGNFDDAIVVETPLVAEDLFNFRIFTYGGNDALTVGDDFRLPDSGGQFLYDAGTGVNDQLYASGDASFTLSDTLLSSIDSFTSTPQGLLDIASVERARLIGGLSANILNAGFFTGGPVQLFGGPGGDFMLGGSGADLIDGQDGNDTIVGSEGDDSLYGGSGSDQFIWDDGDGNDLVEGDEGDDVQVFNGTIADDSISLQALGVRLQILMAPASLNIGGVEQVDVRAFTGSDNIIIRNLRDTDVRRVNVDLGIDAVRDFVQVSGTNLGDDVGITTPGANSGQVDVEQSQNARVFITNSIASCPETPTDDILILSTGQGNDTVQASAGVEEEIALQILAQDGDDFVRANAEIFGGEGNDTLEAAGGLCAVNIDGGPGNDSICGGNGNDTLFGNDGRDTIYGNDGDDRILGGSGRDWLAGNDGIDEILGDAGNDTLLGGAGGDLLYGLEDNDLLLGDADAECGEDVVLLLDSGQGNDLLEGGTGNDTLNGDLGDDFMDGGAGNDLLGPFSFEGIDFTDAGNDTMIGGTGLDTIQGDTGNDELFGNEDDDLINGNAGNDTAYGGLGNDTLFGEAGSDILCGGLAPGEMGDPALDGNDLIDGGAADDALNGDYGNDTLYGGEGNDQVWGSFGDDSLEGGAGNDSMVGGAGNDVVKGDAGNDFLWGMAGNDTLWGGDGNDLMYGGTGDDVMLGGTPETANVAHHPRDPNLPNDGNDTMLGGDGFDVVDGGNGNNLLDAGDDGIRETVLGGTGNDIGYSHQVSPFGYHRSDAMALDGGFNHDLHRGGLIEVQPPAEVCGFTVFVIPANAFIGQKRLHNGVIVDHPRPRNRPVRDRIKLRIHQKPARAQAGESTPRVPSGPRQSSRSK